jgi:hypothetical protein
MFKETIRRGKVRVHGCPASREQLQGTPPWAASIRAV